MSQCELDDDEEVVVALHVEEDLGCIRLEMNPKSQALEATEKRQVATPVIDSASAQNNPENIENLQNASTMKKEDIKDQNSTLKQEKSVEVIPGNTQLTIDQSQPIEPQPDLKDTCRDRVESVNQTRLLPQLSSHYPSCGAAIHSTDPIHETQAANLSSQNRSQDLKDIETKLSSVLEEGRCKVVPRESCNHRYFFPGTRTETLESIRRVAKNGTEALQSRLRVAVLRENELRMDTEMARAEIEAAKTDKALAEILLDDTKHHEAMLQKELQVNSSQLAQTSLVLRMRSLSFKEVPLETQGEVPSTVEF